MKVSGLSAELASSSSRCGGPGATELTHPEQSFESMREQVGDEAAGCYFNHQLYAEGSYVLSGSTYLRCERGIWVETGTKVPAP